MELEHNPMLHEAEMRLTCPHCEEVFRMSTLKLQSGLPVAECPHCLRRIELPSVDA